MRDRPCSEVKPNILFLMSDEHRPDITGYEGDTIVRTPTLDRLAAEGMVFRNAYTPSPVCIPARQCLMAGQLPRHCACETYGQDLAPNYMTFARVFSRHAYNTVVCGKLHHMGTDQMQGWTRRIGGDLKVERPFIESRMDEAFDRYEDAIRAEHRLGGKEGFKWSDAKEIARAGIGYGPRHIEDNYTILGALDFIEQYFNDLYYDKTESAQPVLLKVSLTQPHYPYLAKEDKFKYYLNRVNPFENQVLSSHPYLSNKCVIPGVDATRRDIRRTVAAYYAMIEEMDENLGKVITALEEAGQNLDDWIILYTSDHGEMLGEHQVWEKFKFYEASVRVPLIIRYPKRFKTPRVIDENVNLCDLFATLCDFADLPCPEGLDSRSLLPLMRENAIQSIQGACGLLDERGARVRSEPCKPCELCEPIESSVPWDNETISQFGGTHIMIKRDHLKYQYYGAQMPEVLFDLRRDPTENTDFINDISYADQLIAFRKRRAELGF